LKNTGVKIKVNDGGDHGYLLRRLNADAYEVWLEQKGILVVLSPKEFVEVENE
jgi:hypothetical protein